MEDAVRGGDEDLPRQFQARAMFALAAACEPPSLRPECPFSVDLAGGVRTCREQCRDVLEGFGIVPPGPELVLLPVVGALPVSSRAFDASEYYLHERKKHMSRWSMPSLMWALRKHLTRTPVQVAEPGDAERETLDCLAELSRRGFDVDDVVRQGLREEIVIAVILATLIEMPAWMLEDDDALLGPQRATASSVSADRGGWVRLLDEVLGEEHPEAGLQAEALPFEDAKPDAGLPSRRADAALQGSFRLRVHDWLSTAPLSDIIAWTAPEPGTFRAGPDPTSPAAEHRRDVARWMVERFTELSCADWSRRTRHLEFAWMLGQLAAPCDESLMGIPRTSRHDLAETIAVDVVTRPAGHERQVLLLKQKAIELLRAKNYTAAAAVLDASRRLDPTAAEPHNDYAFCVLPDDAGAALEALDHARDLGYVRTVNAANRILCLALLGRPDEALTEAARVAKHYVDEDGDGHLLWDPAASLAGGPPVMRQGVSPRDYVLDVAVIVARGTGNTRLGDAWTAVRDRLVGSPPG